MARVKVEFNIAISTDDSEHVIAIRFHMHTKFAIMALMPTLYSHTVAVFSLICKMLVNVKLDVSW